MSMPMLGGVPPMGGLPPMPPGPGAGLPSGLMPNKPKAAPPKKATPASAKNKALADKLKGGGKK